MWRNAPNALRSRFLVHEDRCPAESMWIDSILSQRIRHVEVSRRIGSRPCIKALGLVTHFDSTQMIFRRRTSKSGMYFTIVTTSSTVAKRYSNDDGCTCSKNSFHTSSFNSFRMLHFNG